MATSLLSHRSQEQGTSPTQFSTGAWPLTWQKPKSVPICTFRWSACRKLTEETLIRSAKQRCLRVASSRANTPKKNARRSCAQCYTSAATWRWRALPNINGSGARNVAPAEDRAAALLQALHIAGARWRHTGTSETPLILVLATT